MYLSPLTRINYRLVLATWAVVLYPICYAQALAETLYAPKELTITIPARMKGLADRHPDGSATIYRIRGMSFLTSMQKGGVSSYSWDFSWPLTKLELLKNPLEIIQYITYLQKQGDFSSMFKLVGSLADPTVISELTAPSVIMAKKAVYSNVSGGGIFLAIEYKSDIIVYYYIQKPGRKVLQMDRIKKIADAYWLDTIPLDPAGENMRMNIFTALYDTFQNISDDITITQ